MGFTAPAAVGAVTTSMPRYAVLPELLAAGAVEGAGTVMALVQAVLTGRWMLRLLRGGEYNEPR